MSRRADQVNGLTTLAETSFTAEQAKMAVLKVREAKLRELIAGLDRAKRSRVENTGELDHDPALRAGADLNWSVWVDARRRVLNSELAQLLAIQERAREALLKTFGRQQVTRHLAKLQKIKDVKALEKRQQY